MIGVSRTIVCYHYCALEKEPLDEHLPLFRIGLMALSPPNDNPAKASGLCYCFRTFPGLRTALASRQAFTCFINMTFAGCACLIKV